MSAVPEPVLVVAGTSCLPSSVAFILSAKAGPAKATAAPSASVASMVLVMVLSLSTSAMLLVSQQLDFGFIPENGLNAAKFWARSRLERGPR